MKYLSIIRYVLILISVLVTIVPFALQGDSPVPEVDTMLRWTYVMLGLSAVCVVVLPLFNLAKNPKSALRSLMGLGIVAIVVIIAYSLSSSADIVTATKTYNNAMELKLSDTGLYTTYVAFAVAVLSILVTEVYKLFK